MKRRRDVRPFCRTCGADLDDPSPECKDLGGCASGGGTPLKGDAEQGRKRCWDARDAVFSDWVKSVVSADEEARPRAHEASYANWAYGHSILAAISFVPPDTDAYVLIHDVHDENYPLAVQEGEVSQEDVRKDVRGVAVNSLTQARAIVEALVEAFGDDVVVECPRSCKSCGVSEEKAPYGPGGNGPKMFLARDRSIVCYKCFDASWRKK